MRKIRNAKRERNGERGISLYLVAGGMVFLLGVAALAIDVASLYVARDEAQRAADAGALAGAQTFVQSGFTSGLITQAAAQTLATNGAIAVGAQNKVGGQAAQIQGGDVTFDFSKPEDPRITVVVQRTAARGNPLPTFFAKVLGFLSGDVAATATAEAYNPSGGGPGVATSCLKPWILPNCDPKHSTPGNPFCPGSATFVDPNTGAISNPGLATKGVIGETLVLKSGDPANAPVPSQYYPVILQQTSGALCPSCGSSSSSSNGAALYRSNIECCNTSTLACGVTGIVELSLKPGNMQGPTQQGVSCLIHQTPGNGQDTLNTSTTPFQYIAGANNPFAPKGTAMSSSDSVVTIPLYAGQPLCPGGSCNSTVTILGYLQVFITGVTGGGDVSAVVLNVGGCGSGGGGGGGGGPVIGGGGAFIPVRLVRNPGT